MSSDLYKNPLEWARETSWPWFYKCWWCYFLGLEINSSIWTHILNFYFSLFLPSCPPPGIAVTWGYSFQLKPNKFPSFCLLGIPPLLSHSLNKCHLSSKEKTHCSQCKQHNEKNVDTKALWEVLVTNADGLQRSLFLRIFCTTRCFLKLMISLYIYM